MSTQHTPTADELMANPDWVAMYGGMYESRLRLIAEDQAERAAAYFADLTAATVWQIASAS